MCKVIQGGSTKVKRTTLRYDRHYGNIYIYISIYIYIHICIYIHIYIYIERERERERVRKRERGIHKDCRERERDHAVVLSFVVWVRSRFLVVLGVSKVEFSSFWGVLGGLTGNCGGSEAPLGVSWSLLECLRVSWSRWESPGRASGTD